MQIGRAQGLGALAVLLVSLAVYGISLLGAGRQVRVSPLPWGDQGPATTAVEIRGERGEGGIYFFPERTTLPEILKAAGLKESSGKKGIAIPAGVDGFAITLSADKQEPEIGDLPAARRLALGLKIDINRATVEELPLVPGVGERLAVKIVELRRERGRFEGLADLSALPGVKGRKLEELGKYLTVRPAP